eukprot:scaffold5181_cov370-Prasinococcus_capsulatus_cf.AAC.1
MESPTASTVRVQASGATEQLVGCAFVTYAQTQHRSRVLERRRCKWHTPMSAIVLSAREEADMRDGAEDFRVLRWLWPHRTNAASAFVSMRPSSERFKC